LIAIDARWLGADRDQPHLRGSVDFVGDPTTAWQLQCPASTRPVGAQDETP